MSIWVSFLVIFTFIFVRDGGFHQFHPQWELAILAGFWFFGFSVSAYFFSLPITILEIKNNQITLSEIWLFKKEIHLLKKADIKELYIKSHLDSDGDSHELILQTHKKNFPIRQSNDLNEIEELKANLESKL